MGIKIKVSPGIVKNIAEMYENTSRIFMEYIDNSLDSAEDAYNADTHSYKHPIEISITIDKDNKQIIFQDNCEGMDRDTLLRVVENIGHSKKKSDFSKNGQFGFGIHSYAACANKLEISTVHEDSSSGHNIIISRKAYKEGGEASDITDFNKYNLPYKSGTKIIISDFDLSWWKNITAKELKAEVEKHFEQLLSRNWLSIIIRSNEEELKCSAFNYEIHKGVVFKRTLNELVGHIRGGKITSPIEKPVKIYLKITQDIIPDKRPIFTNKGRQIGEICSIKSFASRSKHKTGLWGHKNLTGYIEVAGLLGPKISRDDFKNSVDRNLLYSEIIKLEDEISGYLNELTRNVEKVNLGKLEDLLSKTLSKLASQENLKFRDLNIKGGSTNQKPDIDGVINSPGSEEWPPTGKGGGSGGKHTNSKIPTIKTDDDQKIKTKKSKKSGFNIRFSNLEQKIAGGELMRSQYSAEGEIVIYKKHPDFKLRTHRNRQKELLISERLVSYLATEIAIHYKDKFFETKGRQPEVQRIANDRRVLFTDITSFIYKFEGMLQGLVNKDLVTLDPKNYD